MPVVVVEVIFLIVGCSNGATIVECQISMMMELRTVNSCSCKSLWLICHVRGLRVSVCDCVYVSVKIQREREIYRERVYLLESFSLLISSANSVNVIDRYQAIYVCMYVHYACRNQCAQFTNTIINRCGLHSCRERERERETQI